MKAAYLKILTWADSLIVMFAEHYYGTLYFGKDDKVEFEYRLTQSDAKHFNKSEKDCIVPMKVRYRSGQSSKRFLDKGLLIQMGIDEFKKNSRGCKLLILGDSSICDPQKVLVGPENLMDRMNRICEEFEKFNGWECAKEDEKKVQRLCDKWDILLKR
jgi:hypothetical protein